VTPFANDLVVTSLTGTQLVQVLEQQWQPAGASRPFLALGNSAELTYSYDPAAPAGQRIVVGSIRISGEPIDLGRTYRVATNGFLAAGGDNFTAFTGGTTELTGLIDFDAFSAYLEDLSPLDPADYTGRATVAVAPAPEQPGTEQPTTPTTPTTPGTEQPTTPGAEQPTTPTTPTTPATPTTPGAGQPATGGFFTQLVSWFQGFLTNLLRGWFIR
jgi:5'-nucleotidase